MCLSVLSGLIWGQGPDTSHFCISSTLPAELCTKLLLTKHVMLFLPEKLVGKLSFEHHTPSVWSLACLGLLTNFPSEHFSL